MQNWIFYGIMASFFFGLNAVVYKIAYQKGYFSPYYGSFMFGMGILIVFGMFLLFKPGFEFEWKSSGLAAAAGAIWAFGFLSIAIAVSQKADIARLAPIYNTNTIIAVLIGIIFLKEIPDKSQVLRIVSGAVLIVLGAVMVSL